MVVESGNTTAGEITYFEIRLPGEDSLRPTAWEVLWERTPKLGHIVCTSESTTAHHFRHWLPVHSTGLRALSRAAAAKPTESPR